jgi:hypothetical protein
MKKTTVLKTIQGEIEWCKTKTAQEIMVHPQYKKGFVAGLKQAKRLLRSLDWGNK